MKKKVFVGLSGGVDSSLCAALLLERGYEVVGVYMKNWTQDIPGFDCPWMVDYQDAKRLAMTLDIPIKVFDFESQYRSRVVDYMIDGYRKGITPNPDIMCNQEIKFKLFLDASLEAGADLIATGHYAKVVDNQLMVAEDDLKDQTYFLYRMSQDALKRSLMPIGDFKKTEVRKLAAKYKLPTATKKDSQGICFIGKVGIKEFLIAELGPQRPGDIINETGRLIGKHDGAIFYTIGQRHGLDVGGGLPYYVCGKDMASNVVYVTTNLNHQSLWRSQLKLDQFYWTSPGYDISSKTLEVRTRYRAKLVGCQLEVNGPLAKVSLTDPIRAITPGQSAVFYDNCYCVGGGIVI